MKKVFGLLIVPASMLIGSPVFAAPPQLGEMVGIISNVFNLILPLGVLAGIIMGIVGGYMWIMAGGDAGRTQQAQGTITWAVIGIVFLFLLRMILTLVFGEILS